VEHNGWIKLHRKMLHDEKVRVLSLSEHKLWVSAMLIASSHAKILGYLAKEGFLPMSAGEIAEEVGLPKSVVWRGLRRLCELGLLERGPWPFDRRLQVYRVVNFARYQSAIVVPPAARSSEQPAEIVPPAARPVPPAARSAPKKPQVPVQTSPEEVREVKALRLGCTEEEEEDVHPPANSVAGELVLTAEEGPKTREESEKQRLIRKGFEHLTGQPIAKIKNVARFHKSCNRLLSLHGIDWYKAWVDSLRQREEKMPEGCIPEIWFPDAYRTAMETRKRKEAYKR
jgi:DNA-binding MarR family transcriptional regulator